MSDVHDLCTPHIYLRNLAQVWQHKYLANDSIFVAMSTYSEKNAFIVKSSSCGRIGEKMHHSYVYVGRKVKVKMMIREMERNGERLRLL